MEDPAPAEMGGEAENDMGDPNPGTTEEDVTSLEIGKEAGSEAPGVAEPADSPSNPVADTSPEFQDIVQAPEPEAKDQHHEATMVTEESLPAPAHVEETPAPVPVATVDHTPEPERALEDQAPFQHHEQTLLDSVPVTAPTEPEVSVTASGSAPMPVIVDSYHDSVSSPMLSDPLSAPSSTAAPSAVDVNDLQEVALSPAIEDAPRDAPNPPSDTKTHVVQAAAAPPASPLAHVANATSISPAAPRSTPAAPPSVKTIGGGSGSSGSTSFPSGYDAVGLSQGNPSLRTMQVGQG